MIDGLQTFEHRALPCPGCGEVCNKSDGEPGTAPRAGDISICAYCASINVWEADGAWRGTPLADFDAETQARLKGALRLLSAHLRTKGSLR